MGAFLETGRLASGMEILINAANALYLVAYFARDMRWLRALTIVAAGLLAAYFWLLPEPVMTAVVWNLLFGALNAIQLLRPSTRRCSAVGSRQQASLQEKHGVGVARWRALARLGDSSRPAGVAGC